MNPVAFVFYNPDQLIVNLAIVLWLSFETKSAEVLVWLLSWLCIPNLYPLTTPFNRRFEENRIYVPVSKILKWFTD